MTTRACAIKTLPRVEGVVLSGVRVKAVQTEQGCFVNRALREKTRYFLTWAARDKRMRP